MARITLNNIKKIDASTLVKNGLLPSNLLDEIKEIRELKKEVIDLREKKANLEKFRRTSNDEKKIKENSEKLAKVEGELAGKINATGKSESELFDGERDWDTWKKMLEKVEVFEAERVNIGPSRSVGYLIFPHKEVKLNSLIEENEERLLVLKNRIEEDEGGEWGEADESDKNEAELLDRELKELNKLREIIQKINSGKTSLNIEFPDDRFSHSKYPNFLPK